MKKIAVFLLSAALLLTLRATNPTFEEFGRYYTEGTWIWEESLWSRLPEGVADRLDGVRAHLAEGEARQDYIFFSVYSFGGRLFLGMAGDVKLIA